MFIERDISSFLLDKSKPYDIFLLVIVFDIVLKWWIPSHSKKVIFELLTHQVTKKKCI